ncbi:11186_t:CDS:1, partial [Acaulospora morrowiae]
MGTAEDLVRFDLESTQLLTVMPEECPYHESQGLQEQVTLAYEKIRRARSIGNRISSLTHAYYLGARIQTLTSAERFIVRSILTAYYLKAAIRTYYLFESYGVAQIYRTTYTTLPMIVKLTKYEFNRLVMEEPVE